MLGTHLFLCLLGVASALGPHIPPGSPRAKHFNDALRSVSSAERIDHLKAISTVRHGGKYGDHAASQLAYLKYMLPDIEQSLRVQDGSVIYDLGCADGINTMQMLAEIQKVKPQFTAGVVDKPGNDWDTVRRQLVGYVGEVVPAKDYYQPVKTMNLSSIIGAGLGISDGARGGSGAVLMGADFFQQVAKTNSVNVAVSSSAVQFLSGGRLPLAREQAAADWLDFLRARGMELVEGGTLHASGWSRATDGSYPPRSHAHALGLLRPALEEALSRGLITKEQQARFKLPVYQRSDVEWQQPFLDGEVPGLRLEKFEMVAIRSPYWTEARYNMDRFSRTYVPSVMAWVQPYLESELGPGAPGVFEGLLAGDVRDRPWDYQDDYLQAVMVIRKETSPRAVAPGPAR